MVVLMLAGVLFPLWPPIMRLGVWYLSIAALAFIGLFFAIAIVRLIFYIITIVVASPGIWIFPKLFADVGFVSCSSCEEASIQTYLASLRWNRSSLYMNGITLKRKARRRLERRSRGVIRTPMVPARMWIAHLRLHDLRAGLRARESRRFPMRTLNPRSTSMRASHLLIYVLSATLLRVQC